jgi:hypothetical protein
MALDSLHRLVRYPWDIILVERRLQLVPPVLRGDVWAGIPIPLCLTRTCNLPILGLDLGVREASTVEGVVEHKRNVSGKVAKRIAVGSQLV